MPPVLVVLPSLSDSIQKRHQPKEIMASCCSCCCGDRYRNAKVDDDPKKQPLVDESSSLSEEEEDEEAERVAREERRSLRASKKVGDKSIYLDNVQSISEIKEEYPVEKKTLRGSVAGVSITNMLLDQPSFMKDSKIEEFVDECERKEDEKKREAFKRMSL